MEYIHLAGGVQGTLCGVPEPKSKAPVEVTCPDCVRYLISMRMREPEALADVQPCKANTFVCTHTKENDAFCGPCLREHSRRSAAPLFMVLELCLTLHDRSCVDMCWFPKDVVMAAIKAARKGMA